MIRKLILLLSVLLIFNALSAQTLYFKILWDPNPEPNVVKYKIFRGTNASNLSPIDSTSDTFYFDFSIQQGIPYFYGVKAVNDEGLESELSEIRQGIVRKIEMQISPVGNNGVQIQWNTAVPTRGMVKYGKNYPLNLESVTENQLSTSHSIIIDNPGEEGLFYFSCLNWDANDNLIASQDSFFVIGDVAPESPQIIVYPNPLKSKDQERRIYFTGLPINASITIYNLMGEALWTLGRVEQPFFVWNVTDKTNHPVRSGVYLYIIKTADGKEITKGKLVIIN